MTVRAKFRVDHISPPTPLMKTDHSTTPPTSREVDTFAVALSPVTSGSAENEKFYELTPGGSISLSIVNAETVKSFEVGKTYYVDFTPAG